MEKPVSYMDSGDEVRPGGHLGEWGHKVAAITAGIILAAITLALLWFLLHPMVMLFLGITIAVAIDPLADWLEQWIPRVFAVILIYLLLLVILVGIGGLLLPPLVDEAREFSMDVPELLDQARAWLEERGWEEVLPQDMPSLDTILDQVQRIGGSLVQLPGMVATSILDMVFLFFLSLYWVIFIPEMHTFISSLFPRREGADVTSVLHAMGDAMGGYVRGVLISAAIIASLVYVGLLLIGVPFALVLGVLAGFLEIIPVIGPILAGIPIVGIALAQSPQTALFALLLILAIQQLESNIIIPNVMQSQAEVSPLLAIIAVFAGNAMGGILGVLVAVPIVAAVRIFAMRVLVPWVRKRTGVELQKADDAEA